jgi:hypothetical protein
MLLRCCVCIFVANSLPVSAPPTEWRAASAASRIRGVSLSANQVSRQCNYRGECTMLGRLIAQTGVRGRPVSLNIYKKN